ncbi:MAG TPA: acyl-CoA dehydrogenase family protein [Trebonia sp.]|jgi:3-hydroxy-9,10-secoandrosta-1,3,5(10)-triene-9,17-dione monooxygenase|nr:acyl-CoA dehydrogenase family protein [Trebonia sp.]
MGSALTGPEAVERARQLVPVLAERAAKAEALRRLPDETFADLVASGLFRITQPRRFGGSELDLADAFGVINQLSQGCGSTGWTYALLTSHGWFLSLFPDEAQREVWEADPDAVMSTSFSGGVPPEPVPGGGWRIGAGTWRADVLAATTPGREVNDGPLYKLPLVGSWQVFLTTAATGIARAAMDAWIVRTKSRVNPYTKAPVTADPAGLAHLGSAAARIEAAETLIQQVARRVTADVESTGGVADETRARGRRDYAFAVRLCVEAVEELFLAAGASTLDESSVIQRCWRDVHAVAQHQANNLDVALRSWGERALGLGDGLRFG